MNGTDQTPAANIASHIAAMDDDTLNRFIHTGTTDELERGIAIAEQRRRNKEAAEARAAEHHAEALRRRDERSAARRLAGGASDGQSQPETLPAATGQRRGSEWPSKNQQDAETFASILRSSGLNAKAVKTTRIQGRDVYDGWTVNIRDQAQELGVVACWHGRRHFICYLELTGHAERTEEAAAIMMAALKFAWGGGAQLP